VTLIGYTMMCEQAGPKLLVRDVALAEEAGFDFAVISDHYFPRRRASRTSRRCRSAGIPKGSSSPGRQRNYCRASGAS
jgi:alkanesulfonate monooxygenase SsuD/methylene tetrahydromethanopterin reductase-like flavin-dependent oxidoreductase (luciferase family)